MFAMGTNVSNMYSSSEADNDFERNFRPYRKRISDLETRIDDLEILVYKIGTELLALKETKGNDEIHEE